jgi:hypothetical protein
MPRPNASGTALRRIMQHQLSTGKILVALAEAAQQAIIDGDIVRLEELAPRQRGLLDQQIAQERARKQVTTELSHLLGQDCVPTLSSLLPAFPPAEAKALDMLRGQIVETEQQMQTLNRSCAILLDNALDCVKFGLEAITSAALKPARYGVNLAQLSRPSFYIDSRA